MTELSRALVNEFLLRMAKGELRSDLTLAEFFQREDRDIEVATAQEIFEKEGLTVHNNSVGIGANSSGTFVPYVVIDYLWKSMKAKHDPIAVAQEIGTTAVHELIHTRLPCSKCYDEVLVMKLEMLAYCWLIPDAPLWAQTFALVGIRDLPVITLEPDDDMEELE